MISKFFQPKQQQKKRSRNEISSSTSAPEDAVDIMICASERNAPRSSLPSSIVTGTSANFAIEIIDINDDDDDSSAKKENNEEKVDHPTARAAGSSSVDICRAKDIDPAIEIINGDQIPKDETNIRSEIKIKSSTATIDRNNTTSDLESDYVAVTSPTVIAFTEDKINTEGQCLFNGMKCPQKDDPTENITTETTNSTPSTDNKVDIEKENQPNHASFHQNDSATEIPIKKTPPSVEDKCLSNGMKFPQKDDPTVNISTEITNASASTDNKVDIEKENQPNHASFRQNDKSESTTEMAPTVEDKCLSNGMKCPQKDNDNVNITTETTNTSASTDNKVDIEKENQPNHVSFHQNDKSESTTEISYKNAVADEVNPFAQFAFQDKSKQTAYSSALSQSTVSTQHLPPVRIKTRKDIAKQSYSRDKKKESLPSASASSQRASAKSGSKKEKTHQKWVRMVDLSVEEQNKITQKWHSLADPNAPLEVRRFQIVVAARLHARCQETVVRKVMKSLREVFTAEENDKQASSNHSNSSDTHSSEDHGSHNNCSGLCVSAVAKADPEVLANVISSIQYYNTKAKHIVMAANEIESRFGGLVPESEHNLKSLTGIGEVMGDLLAFVNNREAHLAE